MKDQRVEVVHLVEGAYADEKNLATELPLHYMAEMSIPNLIMGIQQGKEAVKEMLRLTCHPVHINWGRQDHEIRPFEFLKQFRHIIFLNTCSRSLNPTGKTPSTFTDPFLLEKYNLRYSPSSLGTLQESLQYEIGLSPFHTRTTVNSKDMHRLPHSSDFFRKNTLMSENHHRKNLKAR